ncbi:MAG: twin-arginine translocase TatA/TatE family subunit [Thermoleophilia bacterium]|nr:twin-arginine translocase TatA/TatE family subunit [Thermoleophilia bacterium]
MDFSPIQILIVLAIALIVFGPRKLPEMAKSVGKGVREFKASISMDEPPRAAEPRATATAGEPVTATEPAEASPGDEDGDGDVLEGVLLPGDEQPPDAR